MKKYFEWMISTQDYAFQLAVMNAKSNTLLNRTGTLIIDFPILKEDATSMFVTEYWQEKINFDFEQTENEF